MSDTYRCLCRVLVEEYENLYGSVPPAFAPLVALDAPHTSAKSDATPKAPSCSDLLPHVYRMVHETAGRRAALCLSGGGIRSATFALGVIEFLAERGLLSRFDYLSTVSGGGFTGGWLSAWIHREGVATVEAQLGGARTRGLIDPEPPPVRHLRFFSNYLSPRIGLLSADAWTLAATYLRNLLLTWLVFLPLLAAALLVPRVFVAFAASSASGASGALGSVLMGLGVGFTTWALAFVNLNQPSESRGLKGISIARVDQPKFLRYVLAEFLLSAVALTVGWALYRNAGLPSPGPIAFAVLGILMHLASMIAARGIRAASPAFRLARGKGLHVPFFVTWALVVLAGAAGGVFAWSVATSPPFDRPGDNPALYALVAAPAFLVAILLAATLFVGGMSKWMDDDDREWLARVGAWILVPVAVWVVGGVIVVYAPGWIVWTGGAVAAAWATAGVSGVVTALAGFSAKTSSRGQKGRDDDAGNPLVDLLARFAAPIFAVLVLVGVSLGTDRALVAMWEHGGMAPASWVARLASPLLVRDSPAPEWTESHASVVVNAPGELVVVLLVALAAFGCLMALGVNTNRFSLHAVYRARIIRAFLGASRLDRSPNPFTGFDPDDNVAMHELSARNGGPLHVVNMALNVVSGENLAWQERKAVSFTASPLHCGSYCVGYRTSTDYGGDGGMSLGTAVAISGAAASPNMGYHSSPVIAFLLTLFNARLGWWIGNPGRRGDATFDRAYPRFAAGPIVEEALGLTSEARPYVYLSDGGHFENLALYEMVVRRCRVVVLSDAGCDGAAAFEDLGNAVRKIRIDLGVPIEFDELDIRARGAATPGGRIAFGRIRYSAVDATEGDTDAERLDGLLIYLKPAYTGVDEPTDVRNYAVAHDAFPHEPTSDQWFGESQFESYRALGYLTARAAGVELSENLGAERSVSTEDPEV